jgi:hypothetical protein
VDFEIRRSDMRTVKITVYAFNELSDKAKDFARNKWREHSEYPWWGDAKSSIEAFCAHFDVTLRDYEVSTHRPYHFKTDADNARFRGKKVQDYTPEGPAGDKASGYYLDLTLWGTFHKTFKEKGDAKYAFNEALHAAFKDVVADMEWHDSDECVDELLTLNEYEFTADGRIH